MAASDMRRRYDVAPDVALPDLSDVAGVDAISRDDEQPADVRFFDTDDLRLSLAGISLWRDTGTLHWHLHLPGLGTAGRRLAEGQIEEVPDELAALVRGRVRGRALQPVGQLVTRRTRWQLQGTGGAMVVAVDEHFTGLRLPDGPAVSWREWGLEGMDADPTVVQQVHKRFRAAGARTLPTTSYVWRVLQRPVGDVVSGPGGQQPRPKHRLTAGDVVQAHLSEQVNELVSRDPQVRLDLPDAVHKMRVATRRLRSALATFRPILEPTEALALREELSWLADVLGAPRDAEVLLARLRSMIDAEPPELVLGKVKERLEAFMTERHQRAHEALVAALDSDRYLRLLDHLDAWVFAPPWQAGAEVAADRALAKLMRRTWRRLGRSLAAADRADTGPGQAELLHQVRKDAKRARYAAEAVEPVFGRPARSFARAMTEVQENLGELQDGVVSRDVLRILGARGHLAGENGFTFGRLHALEQARAEQVVASWPALRRSVSRRRLRNWFAA